MRKYENRVQKIKSEVYTSVSKYSFEGVLEKKLLDIPIELCDDEKSTFRCCIYHDRAVTADRVKVTLGGNPEIDNRVEVIPSACDECQENRYVVNNSCRGCLATRCIQSCPVNAMTMVHGRAFIDNDTCIECGLCHKSCPYNAISDVKRSCVKVCPTGACTVDSNKKAVIDSDTCIRCGACVYYCPFGAILDKSQITQIIELLKSGNRHIYAMVAPSIVSQFEIDHIGKIVTALKKLGFKDVIEVALGADMVTKEEGKEFAHKLQEENDFDFMTSSCCPAFVKYIEVEYPELCDRISTTISPMVATDQIIKSIDKDAITVFIGPCIAKKDEAEKLGVDFVLTYEEMAGVIQGKGIEISDLESSYLNNASYFGRGFASSGGVSEAVKGVLDSEFNNLEYNVVVCNGIDEVAKTMKLAKKGLLKKTFIEGMACKGGCLKGPVSIQHGNVDVRALKNYCEMAKEKSIDESLRVLESLSVIVE